MTITKAVVFAAGAGTRMQRDSGDVALAADQAAAAAAGHKALMPVGRPFLDYVLSTLADAGITEVCLVVNPAAPAVRDHYEAVSTVRLRLTFAEQHRPRGTADALACAREFAGDDHIITLNGDNHYPEAAIRALAARAVPGLVGFSRRALVEQGNVNADRLGGFALIASDASSTLVAIQEKPDDAVIAAAGTSALYSMNLWAFSPAIFDACARIGPSPRGELELPDAVRSTMVHEGLRYRVVPSHDAVLDLSSRRDVATVADRLRDRAVQL
jgi:glucose-1-phosphate thymidylyltransferase